MAKSVVSYPTDPTGATASVGLYDTTAFAGKNGLGDNAVDAILQGYLPILFAKATMKEFYDNSILPRICNVQFEAELKKMGDKIYIRKKPDIEIGDYKVGQNVSYQELAAPEPIVVTVDKAYSWGFREHDVVTQQTDIKQYVSEMIAKIAQRVRDYIEPTAITQIINQLVEADTGGDNNGLTAGAATHSYDLGTPDKPIDLSAVGHTADELSVDASNLIADLYGVLKEQNVLEGGAKPFIVAPHRFLNVLAKSAIQNASFADGGSTQRRGQEAVGMIQGCELYTSNYIKEVAGKAGVFPILCGTTDAVTWVQTITKMEKMRDPNQYADLHRGMGIYGYKVVEPKCLAVAYVTFKPKA